MMGGFRLTQNGSNIDLPKSKKTRALLAYLIVTGRPQRRESLCELFWETSHDPKASLRWSLSQLKKVADQIGVAFLEIDRERVHVNSDLIEIDAAEIYAANEAANLEDHIVEKLTPLTEQTLLAGLDLPNLGSYSAWLMGEQQKIVDLSVALISASLEIETLPIDEKIKLAKHWLELRPFDTNAATSFLTLLKQVVLIEYHYLQMFLAALEILA